MAADDHGPKGNGIYSASGASDDGADLTEIAAYAAEVGNRRVGTTAQRNAAVTEENGTWEGLIWGDTTDGNEYRFTSGSWVILFPQVRASTNPGGTKNAGVGGGATYNFETWNFTVPNGRAAILRIGASVIVGKQLAANIAGTFQPVLNGNTIPGLHYNGQQAVQNAPIPLTFIGTIPIVGTGQQQSVYMRLAQESGANPMTVWDYRFQLTIEY